MATRWNDLSESSRRLIIAAAIGEAILKTAVLIDIRRRPASQIRGSKRMWIIAAVFVNSAGIGPLSYFAFGRRHAEGLQTADLPSPEPQAMSRVRTGRPPASYTDSPKLTSPHGSTVTPSTASSRSIRAEMADAGSFSS
jgi:Phospholipase_D-nuclease N-terminal